ncbi:hypothetical protein, partial [Cellulomonas biazotea]|uniref:hypothetical protein n=1 Tax=Cellulomonas biazotea TaxID=1709 RepID=UPI0035EC9464
MSQRVDGVVRAPELADQPEVTRRQMEPLRPVPEAERIGHHAQVAEDVLAAVLYAPQVIGGTDEVLSPGRERRGHEGDSG